MSDIKEVRIALEFLKNEKISEIAALKDSTLTKTLYDLYFANFDIIEEYINEVDEWKKSGNLLKIYMAALQF